MIQYVNHNNTKLIHMTSLYNVTLSNIYILKYFVQPNL